MGNLESIETLSCNFAIFSVQNITIGGEIGKNRSSRHLFLLMTFSNSLGETTHWDETDSLNG